jgi:tRNA A37 methylthiotransferase MiaB
VKERNRILREIAARKKLSFMQRYVDQTVTALTLNIQEQGFTEALTDNYLKLRLRGCHSANEWVTARIEEASVEGMTGTVGLTGISSQGSQPRTGSAANCKL